MERVAFVTYQGKQVLVEDFTNLRPGDEFDATLEAARRAIEGQQKGSVLSLFDATGGHYNAESMKALKDFTARNGPFIRASAVVGVEGLLNVALLAVSKFSGRHFATFKDRQSAMDWLVQQ